MLQVVEGGFLVFISSLYCEYVLDEFSFITVPTEVGTIILDKFRSIKKNGREIVTKAKAKGGGGGGSDGGDKGGDGGGSAQGSGGGDGGGSVQLPAHGSSDSD